MQRTVHRALVGDFEQLGALCIVERTGQFDLAFDFVDPVIPRFAPGPVLRVEVD